MRTSGTSDVIDMAPKAILLDSGADIDAIVESNAVISAALVDAEKDFTSTTSQVDFDLTPIATVVEAIGDNTTDHMSSLPHSAEPISIMPKSINLDNISLNSPSSQIVGTPFAIDNSTRFEYPFPDSSQTSDSGSSPTTHDFTPSTSPSSSSFPTSLTSSRALTQLSFPPSNHPTYNIIHPKMKLQANPPIPPNLVKRRLLWKLKCRRSSSGSQHSIMSDESTMSNITDGQQVVSPPQSPNSRAS